MNKNSNNRRIGANSSLEALLQDIPKGHSISVCRVGRHLGAHTKYELTYYEVYRRGTPKYTYMGNTIGDAIEKLRFKLDHQDQRLDCTCAKHAVYGSQL